ncbi:MAG: hypothetical protein LBI33_11595 [Propionibacteriaceae bacterium]|nr:hypothetical protein [Propionibacteriaceae bacterium]
MRTTVTLEPEADALVRQAMSRDRATFSEVVNRAIVNALASVEARPFATNTHRLEYRVDVTKALQLAGELEDEAIIGQMGARA